MSLLVWIPMVHGDCKDQGLLGVETSVINTVTYVDGKLGKAAQIGNGNQVTNGISINTNLVEELGTQYSCSVWVKPLGNHVHYEGAIISSGDWNKKCWAFGVNQDNSKVDIFCGGYNRNVTCSVPINQWTHLVSVNNGTYVNLYKNGELVSTTTASSWPLDSDATNTTIGRETYAGGYFSFNGCIQDLRIYDHALSPLEVKHLAQGLVLHYPLNENITAMNNCYSNPTFSSSSGWNHWGSSGHVGTHGQTTDSDYIFRSDQNQAHWVADGSTATKPYLLYQSPSFSGGFRSMQCICKEENGIEITDDICCPDWNARISGSMAVGHWTSITSLGNGFYWCKVEGLQQDGSNNLIGVYVKPGYKVYFSEMYCENSREICADPFLTNRNTIYDTSGYGNNGTINGSLTVSSDTPKYNISTYVNSSSSINHSRCLSNDNQEWTCCAWVKLDGSTSYQQLNNFNNGNMVVYGTTPILYLNNGSDDYYMYGSQIIPVDEWTHIAFVFKNSTGLRNIYINGILKNNSGPNKTSTPHGIPDSVTLFGQNFAGYVSDYREYATALSADDVMALYKNAGYVDSDGNVYAYEMTE